MFFHAVGLLSTRRLLLLPCLLIFPLLTQEGRACLCFSVPLCSQLPNTDGKRAIFVGYVTDFFPASLGVYRSFEESARNENERRSVERSKEFILQLWGSILSTSEAQSVTLAESQEQLLHASDISIYARRVRFRVGEWLEGNEGEEFELFTDATSCGYSFQMGKEYLVISDQHLETSRWWTGACLRTGPLESVDAQEDLKALRTWRERRPLAPRVYGQIWDLRQPPENRALPDARVRVAGASTDQEATSNAQGRFVFDNLVPGKYRIEITAPVALGSPQELDLSRGGCFEAEILIEQNDAGPQYEILGNGAPRADFASPPAW